MASENIERQMEFIVAQQAQSAARIAEIEDIIVRFAGATRERVKPSELVNLQVRNNENLKKTDDTLARLIAEMERHISERRN
jgi:hypothetical protein